MKRHSTDFEARKIPGNLIDAIKLSMNVMFAFAEVTLSLSSQNQQYQTK